MFAPTAFLAIVLIYLVLVGWLCYFQVRRLKGRAGREPIGEDQKLMRQPGEGLRRRIALLDEQLSTDVLMLMAVPPVAASVPIWLAKLLPQTHAIGWLVAALALFVLGLVICLRRLMKTGQKLRNCRLGLAGERYVADCLSGLAAKGYAIFHDVPCRGASGMFNLDHVVVGCGGVAVIETKTRRKRGEDEGSRKDPVYYDGPALIWPGGFRHQQNVVQAVGNARWLKEHLQKELNIATDPLPVLTVPGWWVEAKAKLPVAALNPKSLPDAIPARMAKTLTAAETDLIVRNLAALCRDVDFNDPV